MRSILESLRDKVENGSITIREAAIALHKAGWTNFIDNKCNQCVAFQS